MKRMKSRMFGIAAALALLLSTFGAIPALADEADEEEIVTPVVTLTITLVDSTGGLEEKLLTTIVCDDTAPSFYKGVASPNESRYREKSYDLDEFLELTAGYDTLKFSVEIENCPKGNIITSTDSEIPYVCRICAYRHFNVNGSEYGTAAVQYDTDSSMEQTFSIEQYLNPKTHADSITGLYFTLNDVAVYGLVEVPETETEPEEETETETEPEETEDTTEESETIENVPSPETGSGAFGIPFICASVAAAAAVMTAMGLAFQVRSCRRPMRRK